MGQTWPRAAPVGRCGLGHGSPAAAPWGEGGGGALARPPQSVFHTLLRNLTTSS